MIQRNTNLGRFAGGPTAGGKPEPAASDTEEVAFDFSAYDELVSSISVPSDLTGSVTTNRSILVSVVLFLVNSYSLVYQAKVQEHKI